MTIDTKASEIAAEWGEEGTDRHNLELAILRHMEHHVALAVIAEREACAKIAEEHRDGMGARDIDDTADAIALAIRSRGAGQ